MVGSVDITRMILGLAPDKSSSRFVRLALMDKLPVLKEIEAAQETAAD